jgi:hypothetical protein
MRFASDDVRDHMVCRKKEWTWNGLHALADEIAPASPPVIARKDEVPYYIAGVLQDADLTNKRTRLPFSSIMDSPPEGQQEATVRPLECGGAGNPFAVFVGRQSPRGGLRAHGGPS